MNEIDPIMFGKMINSIETMTKQIEILTAEVDNLKSTMTGGRGIAIGLMIAAGGLGAGVTKILEHMVK